MTRLGVLHVYDGGDITGVGSSINIRSPDFKCRCKERSDDCAACLWRAISS